MTWIIFDFMVIVKKFHQDNIKNKKKKNLKDKFL
jgi:hypothetical protein